MLLIPIAVSLSLTAPLVEAKQGAALLDHIYMDAMGFGMGCSCLQLTFQSCNITHARRLYDALVPVAPIMVSINFGHADLMSEFFFSSWR